MSSPSFRTLSEFKITPCYSCHYQRNHYSDVIMGSIASQITSLTNISSNVYSGTDQNIKAPRHWPLCGKFTGDRWIPRTKGQKPGKCFHLMTSSWLPDRIASKNIRVSNHFLNILLIPPSTSSLKAEFSHTYSAYTPAIKLFSSFS